MTGDRAFVQRRRAHCSLFLASQLRLWSVKDVFSSAHLFQLLQPGISLISLAQLINIVLYAPIPFASPQGLSLSLLIHTAKESFIESPVSHRSHDLVSRNHSNTRSRRLLRFRTIRRRHTTFVGAPLATPFALAAHARTCPTCPSATLSRAARVSRSRMRRAPAPTRRR